MKKTLVLFLFLSGFFVTQAQDAAVTKIHQAEKLYIFSFTRHVQWPEEYSHGDFEILVLGDTPLTEELKTVAQSKKVDPGNRMIKITRINSVNEIKKCHILFIVSAKSALLPDVLAKVNNQPVLIVTEEPGLGAKGSIINFILKDGKPHFELNQAAANKHNIKISSQLSGFAILI